MNLTTEHPCRMGDCLASLDAGTWFDAISARTFACDSEHAATTSLWNHSRLVAQYAQLVAESLEGISPEEAYLVGLLHEIVAIPNVLGWPRREVRAPGNRLPCWPWRARCRFSFFLHFAA